jgi:hypothetical protein
MPDMLVKLYNLPPITLDNLTALGIEIRQAWPSEKRPIAEWVGRHFNPVWAAECEAALEQRPVTCYIAIQKEQRTAPVADPYDLPKENLLGFACYDTTHKGMFGPTGVHENYRKYGIGKALLLTCLHAMAAETYAYAIIGWVGPAEFYAKVVGATIIDGSEPGIYRGLLKIDA